MGGWGDGFNGDRVVQWTIGKLNGGMRLSKTIQSMGAIEEDNRHTSNPVHAGEEECLY